MQQILNVRFVIVIEKEQNVTLRKCKVGILQFLVQFLVRSKDMSTS